MKNVTIKKAITYKIAKQFFNDEFANYMQKNGEGIYKITYFSRDLNIEKINDTNCVEICQSKKEIMNNYLAQNNEFCYIAKNFYDEFDNVTEGIHEEFQQEYVYFK